MSSRESKIDHVKILKDLIRFDTSVPPGDNYEAAIEYLENLFQGVSCETEKIYVPKENAEGRKNRVNLLVHRRVLSQSSNVKTFERMIEDKITREWKETKK